MRNPVLINHQIPSAICDLVMKARESLDIVTPYYQPWKHFETQLETALNRRVAVRFIFRRDKRDELRHEITHLTTLGAQVFDVERLHAKIFLNDDVAIVGSMNLWEYSTLGNEECALLVSERPIRRRLREYIDTQLLARAEALGSAPPQRKAGTSGFWSEREAVRPAARSETGWCVRCGAELPWLDPFRPLCESCYGVWAVFENADYPERFCHFCRREGQTSYRRPTCGSCA